VIDCPGPITSFITGEQMCPVDHAWQPEDDDTWEETCVKCHQWQERWDETWGDMKRDEGIAGLEFFDGVSREASQ